MQNVDNINDVYLKKNKTKVESVKCDVLGGEGIILLSKAYIYIYKALC